MSIYLSTLFLSVMDGASVNESTYNETTAVNDAYNMCNRDLCMRWDDLDYTGSVDKKHQENASVKATWEELVDFYDVISGYEYRVPFPLRFFVREALIETGRAAKAEDWRLSGACEKEPC